MEDNRFLILCIARTGSTHLVDALNEHPPIQCIKEPFNRDEHEDQYIGKVIDEPSLRTCIEQLHCDYNGIKHVWEPSGWPFREGSDLNRVMAAMTGQKVILLNRRNHLKRLVSGLICRQSGLWQMYNGEDHERLRDFPFEPLDIDEISYRLDLYTPAIAEFSELAAQNATAVLPLWYEEIFPDCDPSGATAKAHVVQIIHFLGFAMPDEAALDRMDAYLTVKSRMNSVETYARIPNIQEVERLCGSDQTGWLFKD